MYFFHICTNTISRAYIFSLLGISCTISKGTYPPNPPNLGRGVTERGGEGAGLLRGGGGMEYFRRRQGGILKGWLKRRGLIRGITVLDILSPQHGELPFFFGCLWYFNFGISSTSWVHPTISLRTTETYKRNPLHRLLTYCTFAYHIYVNIINITVLVNLQYARGR